MSFENKNLSSLVYANGFTLWHFKTSSDDVATVKANTYFDNASNMVRVGDCIITVASDTAVLLSITNVNAGSVTVAQIS